MITAGIADVDKEVKWEEVVVEDVVVEEVVVLVALDVDMDDEVDMRGCSINELVTALDGKIELGMMVDGVAIDTGVAYTGTDVATVLVKLLIVVP